MLLLTDQVVGESAVVGEQGGVGAVALGHVEVAKRLAGMFAIHQDARDAGLDAAVGGIDRLRALEQGSGGRGVADLHRQFARLDQGGEITRIGAQATDHRGKSIGVGGTRDRLHHLLRAGGREGQADAGQQQRGGTQDGEITHEPPGYTIARLNRQ